jgi:thymidylate synthase (FAD)
MMGRMDTPTSFRRHLLDHGYLKLVDAWGRDGLEEAVGEESIIAAARMSTGKGFLGWGKSTCRLCRWEGQPADFQRGCPGCSHEKTYDYQPGDEKLLRFLYENKHATPFEMAGITVEVMAPIFVFREWHRHRTQSFNEMSARYIPLPDVNHVPSVDRLMLNSKTNKQAGTVQGAEELTPGVAELDRRELEEEWARQEAFYQRRLKRGVPKELARTHIGTGRYSRMRASANLRNWLGFVTLRSAPAAMWEIRMYSDALGELVGQLFPRTWALFQERR